MEELFKDCSRSRFSSPGKAKIYLTPSFSRALTKRSDAFISLLLERLTNLWLRYHLTPKAILIEFIKQLRKGADNIKGISTPYSY
jgi:hypothetical protein